MCDPHWRLDRSFLDSQQGEVGANRLQQKFLSFLPTASQAKQITDVLQQTEQIFSTDLFKFVAVDIQGSVRAAHNQIARVTAGVQVVKSKQQDSFSQKVLQRLACFCRCPAGGASTSKELVGAEAARSLLAELQKADRTSITVDQLDKLQPFIWLLSPAEAGAFKEIAAEVRQAASAGISRKRTPSAAASVEPKASLKGGKKVKAEPTDDVKRAQDLFR